MATLRSFNNMLNDYLTYDLLMGEYQKRDWLLSNVEMKKGWKGGPLIVPFMASTATSVSYGGLTDEDDIDEFEYVRGSVDDYKEVWGAMMWHSRDLKEHNGRVNEDSFLSNLPGQIEMFVQKMKETVSINLLNGAYLDKVADDGDSATGVIVVYHPERFQIGQKVILADGSTTKTGYVKAIDLNTLALTLVTTRGGSTALDLSTANYAAGTPIYIDGAQTSGNPFTSLTSQLLSSANGGSSTLFGKSKVAYPYLQAINISGSDITKSNFLEKMFDAQTAARQRGGGNPDHLIMSWKHLGTAMKQLESGSGAYRHIETKANPYGYTEITVGGVKGHLTLVGIAEKDDDTIIGLDKKSLKFHTNEGFKKETDPEGKQYYVKRATSGYKYITDIGMYGELVVDHPCHNFIIHSISY